MVVLTVVLALVVAALAAGAWEMRRLDRDVHALKSRDQTEPSLHIDCGEAESRWHSYVNNTLIPFLDKAESRDLKAAVRHNDPDYHATLLNSFGVAC